MPATPDKTVTSAPATMTFAEGIRRALQHVLARDPKCFAIGQGLWDPSHFGRTMTSLESEFGRTRLIDTPISESACAGAAIGAALCGYRPIVVFQHLDYMALAADQIVNHAARWSLQAGDRARLAVTFRCLVDRNEDSHAAHRQPVHAWFAQIPGLRVVMPSTAADARDLLVASVFAAEPVLFLENARLYDRRGPEVAHEEYLITDQRPRIIDAGSDVTIVASGHASWICQQAVESLHYDGIAGELVDLRVIQPLDVGDIVQSARKTGRLLVVEDGGIGCGISNAVLAAVCERLDPRTLRAAPARICPSVGPVSSGHPRERARSLAPAAVVAAVHRLLGHKAN